MSTYLKKYQDREDWFEYSSAIVIFEAKNCEDSAQLSKYLSSIGGEKISMRSRIDANSTAYTGLVRFVDFRAAFEALSHHSDLDSDIVLYNPLWYIDWKHKRPDQIDMKNALLESMLNSLNEDCVGEVLKYLNPFQLQYISNRNEKMSHIIASKLPTSAMSRVKITMESVGVIGIMNFRYLLLEYGANINELFVSITAFPSIFGFYTSDMKYNILFLIETLARNVKKLVLVGFNLDLEADDTVCEVKAGTLIDLMKAKGVQIIYN